MAGGCKIWLEGGGFAEIIFFEKEHFIRLRPVYIKVWMWAWGREQLTPASRESLRMLFGANLHQQLAKVRTQLTTVSREDLVFSSLLTWSLWIWGQVLGRWSWNPTLQTCWTWLILVSKRIDLVTSERGKCRLKVFLDWILQRWNQRGKDVYCCISEKV